MRPYNLHRNYLPLCFVEVPESSIDFSYLLAITNPEKNFHHSSALSRLPLAFLDRVHNVGTPGDAPEDNAVQNQQVAKSHSKY